MSYSISTLLTRNLHDVFGENDPKRRRAAIDEIFTEDCVFYDPSKGVYRGRDEIDRVAGTIRATHPDFRYQPIAKPEELGNGGRVQWVSGRPGEVPAYAGTDFIIARGGRIAALSFSTSYPELDSAVRSPWISFETRRLRPHFEGKPECPPHDAQD
jgi:SnoaL-like domain